MPGRVHCGGRFRAEAGPTGIGSDEFQTGEFMEKKDYLKTPVRHVDITSFDATPIIEAMGGMSFTARDLAKASCIYDRMLSE